MEFLRSVEVCSILDKIMNEEINRTYTAMKKTFALEENRISKDY